MAVFHNLEYVVTLLIVLSILVVAHEWGHFIIARLFGIRVDDFSIGFGKRLVRLGKRGDTEYNLRMLPFGGFVKIAGMAADEEPLVRAKDKALGKDSDPDSHDLPLLAENVERHASADDAPPAPDEFGSKPLWQRSLVILAGPVMSFILGYVVICLMGAVVGIPTGKTLNKVALAMPGGEGKKVGLRIGDRIVAVDGKPTGDGAALTDKIYASPGKPLTLTIQRGTQTLTRVATPQIVKDDNNKPVMFVDILQPGALAAPLGVKTGDTLAQIDGTDVQSGDQALALLRKDGGKSISLILRRDREPLTVNGLVPATIAQNLPTVNAHPIGLLQISLAKEIKRVGLGESFAYGHEMLGEMFAGMAYLVQHHELHKAAGGIIFMYQTTGLAVQTGPSEVVSLLAQLSISLAVFNMLPIPILDGGHLLSFFIEWVRGGRKMTDQQQQAFLMTGLAIIAVLFLLIMTNDILRTINHQLPQ